MVALLVFCLPRRAREEAGCCVVRRNRKGTVKENISARLLERSWGTDAKQEHGCLLALWLGCWWRSELCSSSKRVWGRTNPRAALSAQSLLLGCYIPSLSWTLTYLVLSPNYSLPAKRTPSTGSHRLLPLPPQRNLPKAPSQCVLLHRVTASH